MRVPLEDHHMILGPSLYVGGDYHGWHGKTFIRDSGPSERAASMGPLP